MDGYALRAEDGALGASLRLIGAAPAGHPFMGEVRAGEAVRVFTGSLMPTGADTVLLQEDAADADGIVTVGEACQPGKHIRRAGQDFKQGDQLLGAGTRVGARGIGLAAAGNHPWLTVFRRPRIAILSTGDEIALPGEPVRFGGIVSSNVHALAALVAGAGGEAIILPVVPDDMDAIGAAAAAAAGADMLVTTGGASVGAYDLVQPALAARGLTLDFWKIAMRPGKPLMFGRMGVMPVLGLPGNPVSALVCALLFLRPAVERMSGLPGNAPATEPARLMVALKANDQREDYVRATLARHDGHWLVTPMPTQDSGQLRALARAHALIKRPAHQSALAAGDIVEIIRLDDL